SRQPFVRRRHGGNVLAAYNAQLGNVTYHVTSRDYGHPAYLEVRDPRGGLKRLDLGNYHKIEQAKQACERHYAAGCDLGRAEKITVVGQSPMSSGGDKIKRLLLVCAIGVAELAMASTLGSRPVLAQSGCGSSWAICRYRAYWRGRYHTPEYQSVQQRIARSCNPLTVWKDACRGASEAACQTIGITQRRYRSPLRHS